MIYNESLFFSLVESSHFLKFLSLVNPYYKVPHRSNISGKLLDKEYNRINGLVVEDLKNAKSVALVPDGSSDQCKESLTNIIAVTPNQNTYLIKTKNFNAESQTVDLVVDVRI